mmetsp:Transcript_65246/g.121639  ORF Transcript_65246/g.121639 Transcript_65246/m.121639 type:complete len:188 (+) Transcript_65246:74-637(+)
MGASLPSKHVKIAAGIVTVGACATLSGALLWHHRGNIEWAAKPALESDNSDENDGLDSIKKEGSSLQRNGGAEQDIEGPCRKEVVESEVNAGLRALGMLSASGEMRTGVAQVVETGTQKHHHDHGDTEVDGVDADETIVIQRVSPEEEERRYFANMGGFDMFGDSMPAQKPEVVQPVAPRKVISYDS